MIRVNEVKFELDEPFSEVLFKNKVIKKMRAKESEILNCHIVRESIDARKSIVFSYVADVEVRDEKKWLKLGFSKSPVQYAPFFEALSPEALTALSIQDSPLVIGFGPAGMFAALYLASAGLKPVVFEMGEDVDARSASVDAFWKTGTLKEHSNVQFGEGGAGTFSDGKLTTRIKDERIEWVLNSLVEAGAPSEIRYKNKPHIGTDVLKTVVKNIREKIIKLGGQIYFESEVTDFILDGPQLKGVVLSNGKHYESSYIIAATGHSSRQFYKKLMDHNFAMEQKPFAIGVRIEHPQKLINASQYGVNHSKARLGSAEYKLTYTTSKGRSVYTFCMCPGGEVVASASERGGVVVNGMSYYKRDLDNANSALLVNIQPEDCGPNLMDSVFYQRQLEQMAYDLGGRDYSAPTQRIGDFMSSCNELGSNEENAEYYKKFGIDYNHLMNNMCASYQPQVKWSDLEQLLPHYVVEAIREALPVFGQKIKGFDDPRVILTGIESRSSSPLRILRNSSNFESVSHSGFYPCGEGAGYSGGITSSAVDGIKVAEAIVQNVLQKYSGK